MNTSRVMVSGDGRDRGDNGSIVSPAEMLRRKRVLLSADSSLPEGFIKTNLFTALGHKKNQHVLNKLIMTGICVAVIPVAAFLGSRKFLLPYLGVDRQTDMISALISVFCVQIIVGIYIIAAFKENDDDTLEENEITKQVALADSILKHKDMKKAHEAFDQLSKKSL